MAGEWSSDHHIRSKTEFPCLVSVPLSVGHEYRLQERRPGGVRRFMDARAAADRATKLRV